MSAMTVSPSMTSEMVAFGINPVGDARGAPVPAVLASSVPVQLSAASISTANKANFIIFNFITRYFITAQSARPV